MNNLAVINGLNKFFRLVSRTVASVADWAILSVVFWLLITPVALILRVSGRDELVLRQANKHSPPGGWSCVPQYDREPGFFDRPW